ncbi:MBL fold metallo-hydrolase [Euzebya tangerina]|uniref:MBL fold metallo-hydrolase n=1 Tax=Euzebya tangerina TaxID=591198 RepID=UPI0013C2EFBA|nr:MBL fold metallo-hydrolase [Euzebya tangerina]
MHITLLGHACIRIDAGDGPGDRPGAVLIDPGVFSPSAPSAVDGIDAVLITHRHPDHIDPTVLGQVLDAADVPVLAEAGAAAVAAEGGITATAIETGWTGSFGALRVEAVGSDHAVIHPDIPGIGNLGLIVDDGETRLFHPGDAYTTVPDHIDVLALPLNAPWAKLAETIEFARAVKPRMVVPVHDHLLRPEARGIYLGQVAELGRAEILDPHRGVPTSISG